MVFGVPFRCDMCDTIINLKIQADNSLFHYDYPISVICPECGNQLNLIYKKDGIFPKDYREKHDVKTDYDLYYSASLPIMEDLHLKPSKEIGLTPFLSLLPLYDNRKVVAQNALEDRFLEYVFPYRNVFQELLPIYRKGNVSAYSKKLVKVFNIGKRYTPINDIKVCRENLFELLENTYNNFATDEYIKQIANPFFLGTLDVNHLDDLKKAYTTTANVFKYNQWQKTAFHFIGKMVAKIEKYMPSLFYCTVGDFNERHFPITNTYTIGVDEVISDYDESFNLIKELLTLIVALSNFRITGDINVFPNKDGGMKGIEGMNDFHILTEGLKMDKIQDYPEVKNYLCGGYNNKIRNGIGHQRWTVVDGTQLIQFRYKPNNDNESYDIQLIDLSFLVVINLLHIMEFVSLIEKLKK